MRRSPHPYQVLRARPRRAHGVRSGGRCRVCAPLAVLRWSRRLREQPTPRSRARTPRPRRATSQANYALVQLAAATTWRTAEASSRHVLAQVRAECPGAGVGSPQNPESTMISYEVIGAMVLVRVRRPTCRRSTTFVRAAARLSWGNHSLTSAVHGYVAELKTLLSAADARICAATSKRGPRAATTRCPRAPSRWPPSSCPRGWRSAICRRSWSRFESAADRGASCGARRQLEASAHRIRSARGRNIGARSWIRSNCAPERRTRGGSGDRAQVPVGR